MDEREEADCNGAKVVHAGSKYDTPKYFFSHWVRQATPISADLPCPASLLIEARFIALQKFLEGL